MFREKNGPVLLHDVIGVDCKVGLQSRFHA